MIELDPLAAGARRLAGKVCIVTGAGQGIGRATARRFAQEGARVVVAERSEESARETATQIVEGGGEAVAIIADVSTLTGAEMLMQTCVERFGCMDVLVNVVGGAIWWRLYQQFSEREIMIELERSLFSALWCCKAALPFFVAQGRGSIVNFGSSVTRGGLYRTPYAVSKGGVEALTRTLAAENGKYGIRVNCVSPGVTIIPDRTVPRLMLRPGEIAAAAEGAEELVEHSRQTHAVALNRAGRPEEQAAVAAFLASDDASFVTGQIVNCDGGVL